MSTGTSERIHSMDALRASTMFLLVPVHAAGLLALNGYDGAWATALYWLVHVFRLPLFFAMSGFFLAFLLGRRGVLRTIRNRSLRILVPLVLALITLVPLTVFVARATGIVLAPGRDAPSGMPLSLEPSFLWFLWYLLIVDSVAVAVYIVNPVLVRAVGERLRRLVVFSPAGVVLLAVPTALALWSAPTWTAEPSSSFVPVPSVLAYYALFFVFGAVLSAHRGLIANASRNAWRWTACALAATLPAAILFAQHIAADRSSGAGLHAAGLLIYAIATWSSLLGLIGLADRYLNRPWPALRYLADASYWIYLSHMPAVVLLVALFGTTALGAAPQFALVAGGALAFSLLTYPLFVRHTLVGRLLNGRRQRRHQKVRTEPVLRGVAG
ncbi:MAG TPA: acyltransferase family protein [Solirubrobacterales bacterium]|nr:acyltransferase family protein [Solirubrobacterales bacterium]